MQIETMPGANHARRELTNLRQRILDQIKDDRKQIKSIQIAGRSRSLGGDMDDELYAQNRDLILAIGEKHFEELVEIERALSALDDGSWGQCVDCENLIEADRLLAIPTAARCIRCQTAAERTGIGVDATPSL